MWQDLLKVALLGTENGRFSEQTLQALQAQGIDVQQEPATVLAQGAALLAQLKKAGFRLETFEGELPKPVQASAENYLSPKSARHLEMMLSGRFEAVLPEFMALALENKKTLPPESLPDLLNQKNGEAMLEKMLPAIGESGRWLLAQNPAWVRRFLLDPSGLNWYFGDHDERLELLRHLRKTDPDESLDYLQDTWRTESASDKEEFLTTFWSGLNPNDEPFLEACLDDRRIEIRELAAALLAKIPGSAVSERTWRRAAACFDFDGKTLKINVVGEGEATAKRDGILLKHPNWKGGAKAIFLGQVVSFVPPERWEAFFQNTPAAILKIFRQSDWAKTLLQAIQEATLFFENEDWLEPLLAIWLESSNPGEFDSTKKQLAELAPAAMMNRLAVSVLQMQPGVPDANSPVFKLLQFNPNAWQDELALLLVNRFQVWLNTTQRHDWQTLFLKDLLKMLALRCEPILAESLEKGWNSYAPTWNYWEKAVEEMLKTVLFRQEMRQELQRQPPPALIKL